MCVKRPKQESVPTLTSAGFRRRPDCQYKDVKIDREHCGIPSCTGCYIQPRDKK